MRATAKKRGVRAAVRHEPPVPPPSAGEGERPTLSPGPEGDPDDAVAPEWRDQRTDPPFDPQTERQQPHGPYELLLRSGETVKASWGMHGTISGGRTWGWITKNQQILTANSIEGWKVLDE